jgi:hypothetical protein
MRAGASVAGIVRNLKKRRIKRKTRRGDRIAWGEGEVKGNRRCQTEKITGVLVHFIARAAEASEPLTWTYRQQVLGVSARRRLRHY